MTSAYELASIARGEIMAATTGARLSSVQAEAVPPVMREAPTNDVGAYLRIAYWMAKASRIAQYRELSSSALTRTAYTYAAQAGLDIGPAGYLVGAGRGVGGAIPALMSAAGQADGSGIVDVARELRMLGQPKAIQAAIETKAAASWWPSLPSLPGLDESRRNLMVVVGGVVILLAGGSFILGRSGGRGRIARRRNGMGGRIKAGMVGGFKQGVRASFMPLGPTLSKMILSLVVAIGVGTVASPVTGPIAVAVGAASLPVAYGAVDALDKWTRTPPRRKNGRFRRVRR
jgi:hypothetical protein